MGVFFVALLFQLLVLHESYAQASWQTGDLIFREGTEPVSDMVMLADRGRFSHVGMLVSVPGRTTQPGKPNGLQTWLVVHATPEEVPGRGDVVVIDTLEFFTAPERSKQYAVYHVNATPKQHQQAAALALKAVGTPFVIAEQGNPDRQGGTYCTTLVWQAWLDAGVDLQITYTNIQIPLFAGDYLLPSNLLASPLLSPGAALD